jgi:hypothetical protein
MANFSQRDAAQQTSTVDAAQAARAAGLVREEEQVIGRAIPLRDVLARTSPQIQGGMKSSSITSCGPRGLSDVAPRSGEKPERQ